MQPDKSSEQVKHQTQHITFVTEPKGYVIQGWGKAQDIDSWDNKAPPDAWTLAELEFHAEVDQACIQIVHRDLHEWSWNLYRGVLILTVMAWLAWVPEE